MTMSEFITPKILSQKDFDTFCQEAVADGQSQDEAAEETVEMFTDSGYDVSRVWVCRSKADLDEKMTAQSSVEQVQKSARGEDSYLNGSFSLAKLRRICKAQAGPDDTGIWRLFYAQNFLSTLVQLLILSAEKDDYEVEDNDDEGAAADHLDKLRLVLEMLLLVCGALSSRGPALFPPDQQGGGWLRLSAESVSTVCAALLPWAGADGAATSPALPPALQTAALQLLRLLSTDGETQKHFHAASVRLHLEQVCCSGSFSDEMNADFRSFLEQLDKHETSR